MLLGLSTARKAVYFERKLVPERTLVWYLQSSLPLILIFPTAYNRLVHVRKGGKQLYWNHCSGLPVKREQSLR